MDPWVVLNVTRGASDAEASRAHRRLIRQYHPDQAPEYLRAEYEERSKRINAARDALLTHPRASRAQKPKAPSGSHPARSAPNRPQTRPAAAPVPEPPPSERVTAPVPEKLASRPAASAFVLYAAIGYFSLLAFAIVGWVVTFLLSLLS